MIRFNWCAIRLRIIWFDKKTNDFVSNPHFFQIYVSNPHFFRYIINFNLQCLHWIAAPVQHCVEQPFRAFAETSLVRQAQVADIVTLWQAVTLVSSRMRICMWLCACGCRAWFVFPVAVPLFPPQFTMSCCAVLRPRHYGRQTAFHLELDATYDLLTSLACRWLQTVPFVNSKL